jgi:hypothetical protein
MNQFDRVLIFMMLGALLGHAISEMAYRPAGSR